jgi:zinc and cadmium transporter
MSQLTHILLASAAGGLLSMGVAALLTFGLPRRWLTRMVSFSTGVLLATALLDLLPEASEAGLSPHVLFALVLAGLVGFFLLEKAALWRHSHDDAADPRSLSRTVPIILVGDGVHNFTDGLMLAATFLMDTHLGWVTALAIIAHEIPQEAGDFVLLLAAGWSRTKAFFWNGLSSLASVLGGIVGYFWLANAHTWLPHILVIAAASFIYLAVSDLMPWLRHQRGDFAWHTGFMAAGIALVPAGMAVLH